MFRRIFWFDIVKHERDMVEVHKLSFFMVYSLGSASDTEFQ